MTTVIVGGARTPMGRLLGSLAGFTAVDLGAHAIRAALAKSGVAPELVEHVIMGNVIQAGNRMNPSRQAAVAAGLGMHVPTVTVNNVCLSGMEAIIQADQRIRLGEADIVVAGGMESMTRAPHLLPNGRTGVKYGAMEVVDAIANDALTDCFDGLSMGASTESFNSRYGFTRADQDAFAAASHQRAHAAAQSGRFADEMAPVSITGRKGEISEFAVDEGVRPDTTVESLSALRPAFSKDGSITAGNSSQISDGAAAVVLMSKSRAEALGLQWIAEIVSTAEVAGPDPSLHLQPANAIRAAAAKAGVSISDLSLFEINEAFAAVGVASQLDLGVPHDIVNVNGGAIAMGHPVGMSGARITLHLAFELARRNGGLGAAALCGGGGQGTAIVVKV